MSLARVWTPQLLTPEHSIAPGSGRGQAPLASATTTGFLQAFVPLPQAAGNLVWKPMTELPCEHDDLTAVMAFMGNEVGQYVSHIQRQIAPDISRCGRNGAAGG